MCGLAGFLGLVNAESDVVLEKMLTRLQHRGPDDAGQWMDRAAGIALGHRRLSILDLSPHGHQPMLSADGRFVIAFNGEIYNFAALRDELERAGAAPTWRGHSDTEVILAAFVHWGIEAALQRFVGMFALAIWDRRDRQLVLARDRIGEKPLYYGWVGDTFLFGSELKALRAHPVFSTEIDRGALALLLRHNYVPAPYSIYRGIHKLLPATYITLTERDRRARSVPAAQAYWSLVDVVEAGKRDPFRGSYDEAVDSLDRLLREAIAGQMVADVPLGAFLSGGVDSSTVVALMQAQSQRPVKTFTVGFHEAQYNEAQHAKEVARHLGTDHTELYVSSQDALDVIPKLPTLYDEPFSDSSQVPTYLIAALARRSVTVCLSGDGGDELFGGYNRYFWGRRLWRKLGWMPLAARATVAGSLRRVSPDAWTRIFGSVRGILPKALRHRQVGDKVHKLAAILALRDPDEMYYGLISHWPDPASVVVNGTEPPTAVTDRRRWAPLDDFTERMMFLDTISYLPDDILVKVDRASMGVSLESRVPLLDHRLIEFAWRLPLDMKVRGEQGKVLLKDVLYRYVPREMVERPKMGFGIPIDGWLRGPLRDWTESLLDERRLRDEGYFNPAPIRRALSEHLSGERNWQYHLWDILMFQAWMEEQSGGRQ